MVKNGKVIVKAGRERSLLRRHPWVFSGAVAAVEGDPEPGATVEVTDASGHWLARAAWSPSSAIACRVWTFDQEEGVDRMFFHRRLEAAWAYRRSLGLETVTNAYRLVHGEADGLPGLVVDVYGPTMVMQCATVATERWKRVLAELLMQFPGVTGVYERSDVDSRSREGLSPSVGLLAGEEPPERFELEEYGLRLLVDVRQGHKTGYYLDQRESRRTLGGALDGKSVLNCFCYTGGFGLRAALEGAAEVIQLDAAAPALELARQNAALNGLREEVFSYVRGDVFQVLRQYRDARRSFDIIVLDPPKFADTQAQLAKASRGYKDINLLGCKLLRPGGRLFTYSCSAAMTPELFRKVVGDAARDAQRQARVVRTLEQAPDHPRSLDFPEGDYLTGLELRLD